MRCRLKGQTLRAVLFNPELPGALDVLSSALSIICLPGQSNQSAAVRAPCGVRKDLPVDNAVVLMHLFNKQG